MRSLNFSTFFAWYDFWIGFYYDRKQKHLYVCPIPMLVFEFWVE